MDSLFDYGTYRHHPSDNKRWRRKVIGGIAGCLTRVSPVLNSPVHPIRPPTHPSSTHPFIQLPVFPPSRPVHPSTPSTCLSSTPSSICLPVHPSSRHPLIRPAFRLSTVYSPDSHPFFCPLTVLSIQPVSYSDPAHHSSIYPIPISLVRYFSFLLSFSLISYPPFHLSIRLSSLHPPSSLIRIPIDPSIPLPSLSSHLCMKTARPTLRPLCV